MQTQGRAFTRQRAQWWRSTETEVGYIRVKLAWFGVQRVMIAQHTLLLRHEHAGQGQHRVISAVVKVTKNEEQLLRVDYMQCADGVCVYDVMNNNGALLFDVAVLQLGPSRPRSAAEGQVSFERFPIAQARDARLLKSRSSTARCARRMRSAKQRRRRCGSARRRRRRWWSSQADWHSCDAVHALYMASQRFMPQTLHTDSEGASDDDASDEQPALVDSDSDAS